MANAVKNYKTYPYISRYESFPYFYDKKENRYYYGLTSFLNNDRVPYANYKVKAGDSYDSIALDHYGCALYYWVICDFNRIFDTLKQPEVGTILKLPTLNAISFMEG